MKLSNCEEIIGTLKAYEQMNDENRLTFIMETIIDIPKDAISIENLEECKQSTISILHLDGKYYLKKQVL
ncbi:hypothetical protein MBGDN05_00584 [Thermoplasmatales archaeon SCGC AB-539-N05]|nr:hypothetical protein MBGDN05_00584 [Thermoplasmatales archaeon SCGC AB-539-N05]